MAENDFDLDSLAGYLHLDRAQVARLVDRGKLPGRKVAGVWRFSPAEIHHWLEERIGASNDEALAQMEGALRRSEGEAATDVSIAELIPPEAIAVPLPARTRGSVITSMAELAAQSGLLWDPDKMADAVRAREDMMPTAQENGVALLHPRRPLPAILSQPLIAFGRTDRALPFGAPHGALTDVFFLICSVDDTGHLRTLARLARLLGSDSFIANLRSADGPHAVIETIQARENDVSS
jgi:PTS system nitrogen regulatory IIA component